MLFLLCSLCLTLADNGNPSLPPSPAGVRRVRVDVVMASVDTCALPKLGFKECAAGIVVSGATSACPTVRGPAVLDASTGDAQHFLEVLKRTEKRGLARILAQSRIVAANGRQGSSFHGSKAPIVVPDERGATHVEYMTLGKSITALPTLRKDGSIHLEIRTEITEGAPVFRSRSSFSTLVMRDGQTVLLGTGMQSVVQGAKIPIFGDLPVIGSICPLVAEAEHDEAYLTLVTVHILEPMR